MFIRYFSCGKGYFFTCISAARIDELIAMSYSCASKSETGFRKRREKRKMESYRSQIIAMLDTVQDAKLMRTICEVLKVIMMNR